MALVSTLHRLWQELHVVLHVKIQYFNSFYFLLLLLFSILVLIKITRSSKELNFPPAPPKLPIIGNIHQLGKLPHRSLHSLSNKYGPLMLLQLGHAPTLVVSSADMAREMMKPLDIAFSYRPHLSAAKLTLYDCKDMIFAPYGEFWRQARKLSVVQLLSVKKVNSFHYVREEETRAIVNRIIKDGKSVINLSELLIYLSNNIVSRCMLGKKFEDADGKSKYGELSRKMTIQLMATSLGDFFPYFGWIDVLSGLVGNLKATSKEFDSLVDQVIKQCKSKNDCDQSGEKYFMDMILQLQKDEMLDFDPSYENVKGMILDMLVAGSDTTSVGLEWTMAELIRNPNTMKKAQEEVRRVVGQKQKIEVKEINQMHYLTCVVKESLRLHPPLPLSLPRETTHETIKMRGYDIPAKSRVFVNVFAIQRDPSLWEKPDDFIPERFENSLIDFQGQHFQFLPFGSGRRVCPGAAFGFATIKSVTANLLYWFDWKMADESLRAEDLDMEEGFGLTVYKKLPLHLVPIPYSP